MIYALGLSICCHLITLGVVFFAPEFVYKVINMLHKNKININTTQVAESADIIKNQKKENNITDNNSENINVSNIKSINHEDTTLITNEPIEENNKGNTSVEVQKVNKTLKHFIKQPKTENQMIEWFKDQNYKVSSGNGFHNITMHINKPAQSKPAIISISLDGTVAPSYQHRAALHKNIYGSTTTTGGRATVVNDGFTTSAFAKYEMGSWWIEIIHSFEWEVEKDSVKDIWLKAKKIRLINDGN